MAERQVMVASDTVIPFMKGERYCDRYIVVSLCAETKEN